MLTGGLGCCEVGICVGIGGIGEGSAKGSMLYMDDGGCDGRTDTELCVRRWFEAEAAVMFESRSQSGAPSISSMSDAKGSRATRGVAVGCGGLGPGICC